MSDSMKTTAIWMPKGADRDAWLALIDHLHRGGQLRVTLANGMTGAIYMDNEVDLDGPYYYIYYSDYWGCHEPICEVHGAFLTDDFLVGATITMTDSIYQQEEA